MKQLFVLALFILAFEINSAQELFINRDSLIQAKEIDSLTSRTNQINDRIVMLESEMNKSQERIDSLRSHLGGNYRILFSELSRKIDILDSINILKEQNDVDNIVTYYRIIVSDIANLKQLISFADLIGSITNFSNSVTSASNPSSYPQYEVGIAEVQKKYKNNAAVLNIINSINTSIVNPPNNNAVSKVHDILRNASPIASGIIQSSQKIFSLISPFIDKENIRNRSLGNLLSILHETINFQNEIAVVNNNLEVSIGIISDQEERTDSIINDLFAFIPANQNEFNNAYFPIDFAKVDAFNNKLDSEVKAKIAQQKELFPKSWKSSFLIEIEKVKRLRFDIASSLIETYNCYNDYSYVLRKYSDSMKYPLISTKVSACMNQLENLKTSFNRAFSPSQFYAVSIRTYTAIY